MSAQRMIAVGYPADPEKRAELLAKNKVPIPVYANSTEMPCTTCGLALLVGPRVTAMVQAGNASVYCPPCLAQEIVMEPDGVDFKNLGNKAIRHDYPEQ